MLIISPTNKEPRDVDAYGSGAFHAPRGNRLHEGVDYKCDPGQDIYSPISGKIVRYAYPYSNDLRWSGCLIENRCVAVMMFYLKLDRSLLGQQVQQGQVIGTAQDITKKYPPKKDGGIMTPHIHLQINWVDPEVIRDGN